MRKLSVLFGVAITLFTSACAAAGDLATVGSASPRTSDSASSTVATVAASVMLLPANAYTYTLEAVRAHPDEAGAITLAAVMAAPDRAGVIKAAALSAAPDQAASIKAAANRVASARPGARIPQRVLTWAEVQRIVDAASR